MADIKFIDNSVQIKAQIRDAVVAFLIEAAGELCSQTKRNSRVDSGQVKGSWEYEIDEGNLTAVIGSSLQNAIWEEFGTGEYAVNGNGRKGYWVFVKGVSDAKRHTGSNKEYTLAEAKRVMAMLRRKGLEAYYTKGKKPNRAFENSKNTIEPKLSAILADKLKGVGE